MALPRLDVPTYELTIPSTDDKIKSNLGLSLAFSGKKDRAIAYLKPLAKKSGATEREKANYALALVSAGRKKEAEAFLGQNISSDWTQKIEEIAD